MALERIYNLQSADTAAIVVPQAYRDTILSGLSAIFNTGTQLDADSIFLVHCIHDYTRLYYNWTIELGINAKSDWAKKWAQHDMNTGYGALDSFMKKYGFSLGNYWAKDAFSHYAYVYTDSPVNIHVAADSFKLFKDVFSAGTSLGIFEQNDYIAYKRDTASHFIFYMVWSNCFSCMSYKAWHYTVTNDCTVTLDSNTYSYITTGWRTPYNCNLLPLSAATIKSADIVPDIYPNPAGKYISAKVQGRNNFTIYDFHGKTIDKGVFTGNTTVDISGYAPGVYIMKIRNADGRYAQQKFIKE